MNTLRKQRGLSFFTLLIIIALIAFFSLVVMKVGPLYIENASVNASVENLMGLPGIGKEGPHGIKKRIQRQLDVDDVKSFHSKDTKIVKSKESKRIQNQMNVDDVKSLDSLAIKFVKSKESQVWLVTADYEARTILFSNVGVFIHFVKTVEVPR